MEDKFKYAKIDIPPYIEPELFYKKEKNLSNRGFSNMLILSTVTVLISIGIIILGVYLGM